MPKIYLYAEVLTHIRQLTLHASIQSEKDESPQLDISSDKKVITVKHDGESSSLYLPTQILGTANVTFETEKKAEINARIQIEDLEEWKDIDAAGIEAPWIASELTPDTTLQCRNCKEVMLAPQTISIWKDLPSQDWADVMDLWYCHKPHEDSEASKQENTAQANGKLASHQGIGMVDLTSFVLHPDDCTNIKISDRDNEKDFKAKDVQCANCSTLLGSYSSFENLIKLNKSGLGVKSTTSEEQFVSYPPSTFIGAQLLSLIESTPVRKVIVQCDRAASTKQADVQTTSNPTNTDNSSHPPNSQPTNLPIRSEQTEPPISTPTTISTPSAINHEETNEEAKGQRRPTQPISPQSQPQPQPNPGEPQSLLLWIFNPNIYYSCSLHPSNTTDTPSTLPSTIATAHRALKIFYKTLPSTSTSPTSSSSLPESQYETLPLPLASDLHSLHSTLQSSTLMLPHTARKFQDWHVGLLDRYERHDSAEAVLGKNPLAREVKGDPDLGDGRVTRWELPAGWQELYL